MVLYLFNSKEGAIILARIILNYYLVIGLNFLKEMTLRIFYT